MTCQPLEPDLWRLTFPEPEAYFIINVLAQLSRQYREDLADLPQAQRDYWQGNLTKGPAASDDLRESQEMLSEARAELRSDRQIMAESWVRDFELAEERNPWSVDISSAERDDFVSMLNDRRLLLGLQIGATESDMDSDPGEIPDEERRSAILEIDVLGHFILVTLGPQIFRP
jgi:hypothetical protein